MESFVPQTTADGSFTFFSQEFGEAFHSHYGARQESFLKFVEPTQLKQRAKQPSLKLLDVCYGLGYNFAASLQAIWDVNPDCHVSVIALEMNPAVPQAAIANRLFDSWNINFYDILTQLAFEHQVDRFRINATLMIGDARETIQQVYKSNFQADAIFLDPFSPPQCPQLWTVEFLKLVSQCLHPDGLLATYSCAAAVRTALLAAGLQIGSTPPVGRKTPGTVAGFTSPFSTPHSPLPLSQEEQEHLLTKAAIPYRDPQLSDQAPAIAHRREQEQLASSLEPTSHWRKRWYKLKQKM